MTTTSQDLPAILAGHRLWLQGDPKGSRANLSRADLSGADLYGANLYGADLYGANLSRANLYGANLSGANLSRANLYGANLYGANLSRANLYGADLSGADLYGANLYGADLYGAKDIPKVELARTRILPDGDLIGWKKCKGDILVKLQIPAKAKRSHAFGRKCRAEFVKVLEVLNPKDGSPVAEAISGHDGVTKYKKGETVKPDSFSDNWQEECAPGIHFFITREEAEAYNL